MDKTMTPRDALLSRLKSYKEEVCLGRQVPSLAIRDSKLPAPPPPRSPLPSSAVPEPEPG
jgi:hypothetical protein